MMYNFLHHFLLIKEKGRSIKAHFFKKMLFLFFFLNFFYYVVLDSGFKEDRFAGHARLFEPRGYKETFQKTASKLIAG